jgi:hypothetical protein
MRAKTLSILGLVLLSFVLQGEDCLLEQKEIAAVFGSSVPAVFVTQGFTEANDSKADTVDAGAEIMKAISNGDVDLGDIDSIRVTGACAIVDSSSGHDARRAGSITVDGVTLLNFDVMTNATGTMVCSGSGGTSTLTFSSAGLDNVNARVKTFLDAKKAGGSPSLVFNYVAAWTSTPPPDAGDPDNFTWHVDIKLQVYYSPEIDVPSI